MKLALSAATGYQLQQRQSIIPAPKATLPPSTPYDVICRANGEESGVVPTHLRFVVHPFFTHQCPGGNIANINAITIPPQNSITIRAHHSPVFMFNPQSGEWQICKPYTSFEFANNYKNVYVTWVVFCGMEYLPEDALSPQPLPPYTVAYGRVDKTVLWSCKSCSEPNTIVAEISRLTVHPCSAIEPNKHEAAEGFVNPESWEFEYYAPQVLHSISNSSRASTKCWYAVKGVENFLLAFTDTIRINPF